MKKQYTILASFLLTLVSISYGQEREIFQKKYQPIRSELQNWDPIRGDWLASSIEAISFNEPIPDRPFPENFTPNQMMQMVPSGTRATINTHAQSVNPDQRNAAQWNNVRRFSGRSNCTTQVRSGRSYGDPHLVSFDGERFSFQTVGEFVMVKSPSQNMEVQVRQRAERNDFSLNSAIAMNVGGDRLAIYAKDYPDADYSTPVRLNGLSVHLQGNTYFLPHGGTIRKSAKSYTIYFPSGEVVTVGMRRDFMNVSVQVSSCNIPDYSGLLGNANGVRSDDFNIRGFSTPSIAGLGRADTDYFKKERQAFLSKEFADFHRINQATSLFDYRIGTSTMYYTDRSYPRIYRDLNSLSQRQRDRARRTCESAGVRGADINGCIYDNAYLNIGPSNPPIVEDPTRGTVLRPVSPSDPINVNPDRPTPPKPTPRPVALEDKKPVTNSGTAQPRPTTTPSSSTKPRTISKPRPTPRPTTKPRTISKPRPVVKPTPRSKPSPRPTPKPKTSVGKKIGGK